MHGTNFMLCTHSMTWASHLFQECTAVAHIVRGEVTVTTQHSVHRCLLPAKHRLHIGQHSASEGCLRRPHAGPSGRTCPSNRQQPCTIAAARHPALLRFAKAPQGIGISAELCKTIGKALPHETHSIFVNRHNTAAHPALLAHPCGLHGSALVPALLVPAPNGETQQAARTASGRQHANVI
jgi:hypothetical protein